MNGEQRRHAAKLFGCVRVVYNDFIADCRDRRSQGKKLDFADTARAVTTLAKTRPERAWLAEVSSVALQQSVDDARRAYRNFFDSLAGRRKGPRVGTPRFKKRSHRQTARFSRAAGYSIRVDGCSRWGFIRLPGFGEVRFRTTRDIDWDSVSSVTLIQNPSGTFEVSFTHEHRPAPVTPAPEGSLCGIDLGLTHLAAIAGIDGEGELFRYEVANPRPLRTQQRKLAREQQKLSRKQGPRKATKDTPRQEGSKNYQKQRKNIACIHENVANIRKDHHDKLSLQIARENQTICLETLAVAAMCQGIVRKAVYDAGWTMLVTLIEQKARDHGGTVARAGRWDPTTQRCSVCAHPGIGKLPLSVREWTCPGCGTLLDRDFNGCGNVIDAAGRAESINACGGDVRLRLAGAVPEETGTHRGDQAGTSGPVGISTL